MKSRLLTLALFLFISMALVAGGYSHAWGAVYKIDPVHSFIEFRIKHLGFSWLYGRFDDISGEFNYDAHKSVLNNINLTIKTNSVDTNHAERDKHLRSKKFLNVNKYPLATFKSTGYTGDNESGVMQGKLTLHGVTKHVEIPVKKIGTGKDPWGGYRTGFAGTLTINRQDYGITYDLGPSGDLLEFHLGIEGIKEQ